MAGDWMEQKCEADSSSSSLEDFIKADNLIMVVDQVERKVWHPWHYKVY
jgi:hypothetical protein